MFNGCFIFYVWRFFLVKRVNCYSAMTRNSICEGRLNEVINIWVYHLTLRPGVK